MKIYHFINYLVTNIDKTHFISAIYCTSLTLVSFPFRYLSTSAFGKKKKLYCQHHFFNDPKALFWLYTCRSNFCKIKEYKRTRLKSFMVLLFCNKHMIYFHCVLSFPLRRPRHVQWNVKGSFFCIGPIWRFIILFTI